MKTIMQKPLIFFLLCSALLVLGATPALAAEQAIPAIHIDVRLARDGAAVITETWDVRGVSSGTEYYKALNNLEGMRVHSLSVWDETGGPYTRLDRWDTGRSREEKAGTSGILQTSKGYELCWGIGTYGDHQYTLQYTLEGLVKDYGDYAGFYHRFVDDMSSPPQSVTIQIQAEEGALGAGNARIWGYGYPGEVDIADNGTLGAYTSQALDDGDYINLLCRFDQSLFPLAPAADQSFEALQKSAESQNSNTPLFIALAVMGGAVALILSLTAFFYARFKLADGSVVRLHGGNRIAMAWSVPFGGSIPAIYCAVGMLRRGIARQALVGAYMIRWQKAGCISIQEREAAHSSKKNPKKEEVILFHAHKAPSQGAERTLYRLLLDAAGHEGVLCSGNSEDWAQPLHEKLLQWTDEVKREGEGELVRLGAAAQDEKGRVRFTAAGFDQAVEILGLQKYLKDMNRYRTGDAGQEQLWGDYLVFAVLFGMGERVLNHMQALDPAYYDEFSGHYSCDAYSMLHLVMMTNHLSNAAVPAADGTGGSASASGGGGFSGGGGGGSR